MFKTGIVSVTFRKKSITEILDLCNQTGLSAIEVGSDVHAPKEDLEVCAKISEKAKDYGIEIVSYGTYYKLGQYQDPASEFSAYISAAKTLGTKNLRIWAGVKNSGDVTEAERAALTEEARMLADLAAHEDMTVSFEYHGGTLTNECNSAIRLIREIDRSNVYLYWQPNQYKDVDFNTAALRSVLPFISNVHVFAWDARTGQCLRFPLADHADDWKQYLDILASDGKNRSLLLEFVKDDSVEHFHSDAKTITEWSKNYAV
jgi:3-dehydroshikimate dehydratase